MSTISTNIQVGGGAGGRSLKCLLVRLLLGREAATVDPIVDGRVNPGVDLAEQGRREAEWLSTKHCLPARRS